MNYYLRISYLCYPIPTFTKMKTKTFLLYLLLFPVIGFTQSQRTEGYGYLLDSVIKISSTVLTVPLTAMKQQYSYNLMNKLTKFESFSNRNYYPHIDSITWEITDRESHYYDAQYNLVEDVYEGLMPPLWIWKFKYRNTYEYQTEKTVSTWYEWDWYENDWNWKPDMQIIDSVSGPLVKKNRILRFWRDNTGNWENNSWDLTTCQENGLTDTIWAYHWYDTVFSPVSISAYDYTYYPDTIFCYSIYPDTINYTKSFYNTDSTLWQEIYYSKPAGSNTFTATSKTVEQYNSMHEKLSYKHYVWQTPENQWRIMTKAEWVYDDEGKLIEDKSYTSWDTINPESIIKYYYYFYNNLLKKRVEYPQANNHQIYNEYHYYYTFSWVNTPEQKGDERILLFPNPAHEQIRFNGMGLKHRTVSYSIFDVTGRQISRGKTRAGCSIDISNLIPGIYTVVINNKTKLLNGKFIKY